MKFLCTTLSLLVVALTFLSCSKPAPSTPKIKMAKSKDALPVGAKYLPPSNYAAHRDQQYLFQSSGGKVAFTDHGQGPTIVLLHGVPTSSWMYRKLIPLLQSDFRVISVDFLGYGSSDKVDQPNAIKTHRQTDYVEELLAFLEIDEYRLLFHDMGGLVACSLVNRDIRSKSHNIKSLYVLNTILSKKGFNHPEFQKNIFTKKLIDLYASPLSSEIILGSTFKMLGLNPGVNLSEAECEGYVLPIKEGGDKALYEFFTGFDEDFFTKLDRMVGGLSRYQGDMRIFWGKKDTVLTIEQLPDLKKRWSIPDSNVVIFPENNHFLAEEVPEKLAEVIKRTK